jgi:DNA-binding MarR family transcriptional regulator
MSKRIEDIEKILENFHIIKHSLAEGFMAQKDSSVTPSQGFVLHFVAKKKKSTVKEIAEKLGITSSATTQLIDGLVRNDILERKEDPDDRRAVNLTLSATGKKKVAYMKEKGMEKMKEIFNPLSNEELETYLKLNQKIAENLRK